MADPLAASPDQTLPRAPITVAPRLLRPFSLALTLGFFHYYTPPRLARRPEPAAIHLRRLSAWHGLAHPPGRRSLPRHRALALQLALLHAAGLLNLDARLITPTPAATSWLRAAPADQRRVLLDPLDDGARWAALVAHLRLAEALPDHFAAWAGQFLRRLAHEPDPPPAPAGLRIAPALWQLRLYPATPPDLLFDLLQLGRWHPLTRDGGRLDLNPHSIARAVQRGYGVEGIIHALETALHRPLDSSLRADLRDWARAAHAYRLQTVCVLETARDEQLKAVYAARRFRPHTLRRLSPRHAVVDPAIRPALEAWLQQRGFALDAAPPDPARPAVAFPDPAYDWLGLRVLLGLGDLVPLPVPPPHAQLATAAARLAPAELGRLEETARRLLDDLRDAIRGRDAFYPALRPPDDDLLRAVADALRHDRTLTITYRTLGDSAPRVRRVRPHSLEQRGELTYLRAWCYLAEAELTFRLDRVTSFE